MKDMLNNDKKIKYIIVNLEFLENVKVPIEYIKEFKLKQIEHEDTYEVILKIKGIYDDGKAKPTYIDRIIKHDDVTSIEINYEDGTHETYYTMYIDKKFYPNKIQVINTKPFDEIHITILEENLFNEKTKKKHMKYIREMLNYYKSIDCSDCYNKEYCNGVSNICNSLNYTLNINEKENE